MTDLTPIRADAQPAVFTPADTALDALTLARLADSVPENTRLAYTEVRRQFEIWCAAHGRTPLPAHHATLTSYVSAMISKGAAPATISQHIGAIRKMHSVAGHKGHPDNERALQLLRGYRRTRAQDGDTEGQATPLLPDALRRIVAVLDLDTASGCRDHVLLLLGFALMARRSELAQLHLDDLRDTEEGIEVTVRASKTDRDSRGIVVAVPPGSEPDVDPVGAVQRWRDLLARRGIVHGPLLRTVTRHDHIGGPIKNATVNDIVQRLVRLAGIPDADTYSAHSLRSGGLTAALRAGVPLGVAAAHGRWSPKSPVVIQYARTVDRWRDNAMRGVL